MTKQEGTDNTNSRCSEAETQASLLVAAFLQEEEQVVWLYRYIPVLMY